jgi:hypothetical protein
MRYLLIHCHIFPLLRRTEAVAAGTEQHPLLSELFEIRAKWAEDGSMILSGRRAWSCLGGEHLALRSGSLGKYGPHLLVDSGLRSSHGGP